jgi:hypothetical protein
VLFRSVPVLLKRLRYAEPAALFFILLLFIYASAVPLPDYFLWLYPIGVFLAVTSWSHLSVYKKLLLVNLPAYVGLFFINIVIGNPVQAGPFYFLFPILHENVVFLHTILEYREWALIFNLFLVGSVILTSLFCLVRSNRQHVVADGGSNAKLDRWKFSITRRMKMVLVVAILLSILGVFAFNQAYSQPIVV